MNSRQRIWVYTILLVIIFSFINFIWIINEEMLHNSSNDDIWGSNLDLFIGVIFVLPYFSSLTVLLHCGYICFKSTPFSGYRYMHYIAIVLLSLTVLTFWILMIYTKLTDLNVPLIIFERIFAISFFTSCIGLVLDLIGTKNFNRQIKDKFDEP